MSKKSDPHILCQETYQVVGQEKKATLEVLRYLRKVESEKVYLKLGYSSLFDFCTSYLKYSEGAAQRRIQATRLLNDLGKSDSKRVKAVEEKIQDGRLNLSQLSAAQRVFQYRRYEEKSQSNQNEKLRTLKRFESLSAIPGR